jgi:hypothetical protein
MGRLQRLGCGRGPAGFGPSLGDAAGFNGNDVGADRAHRQRRGEPVDDVDGAEVAVQQQQHLDQFAGAVSIAVGLAGRRPERLVCRGERARLACSSTRPASAWICGRRFAT